MPFIRRGMALAAVLVTATTVAPLAGRSAATPADACGTYRISLASDGTQADQHSDTPSVSSDGRQVAFVSRATNLSATDNELTADVFVHDRQTGATTLVSVAPDGTAMAVDSSSPRISEDGLAVAFVAGSQVWVRNLVSTATELVSADPMGNPGAGESRAPALSNNGVFVTFSSDASNLVVGDTNGFTDVFLRDLVTDSTTIVSTALGGGIADGPSGDPSITASGHLIAFSSSATNIIAADTNSAADVFVRDRLTGVATLESRASDGALANGHSGSPALSSDGEVLTFTSVASNLAPPLNQFTQVFFRDRLAGETFRVSDGLTGGAANRESVRPAIGGHGRFVAFESEATNLVAGDTNAGVGGSGRDVFLGDGYSGGIERVSVASDGTQSTGDSGSASVSADGHHVAFASNASNLVPGDTNGTFDIFVRSQSVVVDGLLVDGEVITAVPAGSRRVPITIVGEGFSAQSAISFGLGITVDEMAFVSPEVLEAVITIAHEASVGARNLTVTEPGGCREVFEGAVEITERPRPMQLTPSSLKQGETAEVTISGQAFAADAVVEFSGSGIEAGEAEDVVATAFHVTVSVAAGATPGARDVTVVNGDGGKGTCHGCFVVNEALSGPIQSGTSYRLAGADGGVFAFGEAPYLGSTGGIRLNQPIVAMAASPSGRGYWLVASDGGVFAFGDAPYKGSTGSIRLQQPIVAVAASPSGQGYWLLASDGGVFAFGDAQYLGSTGGVRLNRPMVAMAASPSGRGYWLVASDGGVFSFGDAPYLGSTGGTRLNQPVVGMASSRSGKGYWMVASDGGVFSFGDAPYLGSTGGIRLNRPVVGMATNGAGYWLVASDGGVFSFGVPYRGSTGSMTLNRPVIGISGS